jgi:hypothetical protein
MVGPLSGVVVPVLKRPLAGPHPATMVVGPDGAQEQR